MQCKLQGVYCGMRRGGPDTHTHTHTCVTWSRQTHVSGARIFCSLLPLEKTQVQTDAKLIRLNTVSSR